MVWYDGMPEWQREGQDASDWGLPRGLTRIAACWMDVRKEECGAMCWRHTREGVSEERRGEERVVVVDGG